jgi:hypothetical protein
MGDVSGHRWQAPRDIVAFLRTGATTTGALLRLRHHEPAPGQDPPNGGDRRHGLHPGLSHVDSDGLRTGVQTVLRQLFAEPDDLILDLKADRPAGWNAAAADCG